MAEIEAKQSVEDRETQTATDQRAAGEEIARGPRLTGIQKRHGAEPTPKRCHVQPRRPEGGSPALTVIEPPNRREPAEPEEGLRHGRRGGHPCLETQRNTPAPADAAARLAVEPARRAPFAADQVRGEIPA